MPAGFVGSGSSVDLARPQSEQVYDLHVYLVPPDLWRQNLHSAINEVIADSISLGFIRVSPRTHLIDLRQDIVNQIGDVYLPKDYVFLKSVGRCLTQVKARQEKELRAKHFLPPYAYAPEIFILDGHSEAIRASPSTISLSGRGSRGHRSDSGRNTQVLTSNYPAAIPTQSPRRYPHGSYDPMYNASMMGSQSFDPANTARSSGYPAYGQPYSHDISAITNAHRNNINDHRNDEHYRGNQDNSSGYKTLSPSGKSPHLLDDGTMSPTHKANNRISSNKTSNKLNNQYDAKNMSSVNDGHNDYGNEHSEEQLRQKKSRNRTYDASSPVEKTRPGQSSVSLSDGGPSPRNRDNQEHRSVKKLNTVRDSADLDAVDQTERELVSATPTGNSPNNDKRDHADDGSDANHRGNHGYKSHQGDNAEEGLQPRPRQSEAPNEYLDTDLNQFGDGDMSDEKRELLKQLEALREQRKLEEKKRADLVKKARAMQVKTNNQRNQAREHWKKKYYDEKKKTPALEAESQKFRTALDGIHKKYLTALDASEAKENQAVEEATIQYHVDELQRKADAAKMKLTAEMKLRNQAETELRALRAELTQKKMSVTIARNQQMNALGNSRV